MYSTLAKVSRQWCASKHCRQCIKSIDRVRNEKTKKNLFGFYFGFLHEGGSRKTMPFSWKCSAEYASGFFRLWIENGRGWNFLDKRSATNCVKTPNTQPASLASHATGQNSRCTGVKGYSRLLDFHHKECMVFFVRRFFSILNNDQTCSSEPFMWARSEKNSGFNFEVK